MPSNRTYRRRKPLETEIMQNLEEFEYNFCKYVDTALPRKFRETFVKQTLQSLSDAQFCVLRGLRHDATLFVTAKLYSYEDALANLDCVSTRLNRMNDLGTLSDATKATLDMKLYDIKNALERLSNSLRKSAVSQVSAGTPVGETDGLEGCPTGQCYD